MFIETKTHYRRSDIENKRLLINLSAVKFVTENKDGTTEFDLGGDTYFDVDISFEDVRRVLVSSGMIEEAK
jgi:hypothetical protein